MTKESVIDKSKTLTFIPNDEGYQLVESKIALALNANLEWVQQLGTSNDEGSNGVATDSSGNIYITGGTSGNLGGPNAGLTDAFLAKYNLEGTLVWTRQLGSPDHEWYEKVAIDSNDNIYISGATYGSLGGPNAGSYDAWLAKYDSNGNQIWIQQLGTSSDDKSFSVAINAAENIYITGETSGSLGGTNAGDKDAFWARYDQDDGTLLETGQLGTSSAESSTSVATDGTGNVYLTGETEGNLGETNTGGSDAWVAKYREPVIPFGPVMKIGDEFQVNTYTTSVQTFPQIAMDADGDFVITWQSDGQDGDGNGIYAQRYNRLGIPQGSEFRVNTFTPRGQNDPAIAMDAEGDFIVTWSSRDQGPTGQASDVFAQRYDSAGVAQGSEFQVNNALTNGDQGISAVAMDEIGNFVITWSDTPVGEGTIYAERYNSDGIPVGSEFQVNTFNTGYQYGSAVAMDSDGDFVITWESEAQDGDGFGIYAQRYDSAGVPQGSEFRVNTVTAHNQSYPAIAMDSEGNFAITWLSELVPGSSYGIFAQRYNSVGLPLGQEFQINTTALGGQVILPEPAIAMAANGNFVISWHNLGQDGSAEGVYAQYYDQNGTPVDSEFQVNAFTTGGQVLPSLAMDEIGNFTAAWVNNYEEGPGGIKAQQFTPFKNLIFNGSFENGNFTGPDPNFTRLASGSSDLTGWTVGGSGVDWHNSNDMKFPSDGEYVVDLNLDGDFSGTLSQTFVTMPGQLYTLTFDLSGPDLSPVAPVFPNPREVLVDIAGVQQVFSTPASDHLNLSWQKHQLSFTAVEEQTTLTFSSVNDLGFWGPVLDNVSVELTADDPYEPNDFPFGEGTYPLEPWTLLSTINGPGKQWDLDTFEITIPDEPHQFVAILDDEIGTSDLQLYFVSADGNSLISGPAPNDIFNFSVPAGFGGNYLLSVWGDDSGGEYDLIYATLPQLSATSESGLGSLSKSNDFAEFPFATEGDADFLALITSAKESFA